MYRSWTKLTVAAVACVLTAGLAHAVWAQEDEGRKPAANQARPASASPRYKELKLDREAATNPLSRRMLAILSAENLEALVSGADPASVITMTGRSAKDEFETNVIGDINEELVFTPITPCRVIDTRNAGGIFAAGETRGYNIIGPSDYTSIGGNAAGCGIPAGGGAFLSSFNRVRGLVVNVVAASATGLGNFKAWASDATEPTASVINYGTTQNIANGLVLQTCKRSCFLCGEPCPVDSGNGSDLNVKASTSVHLVVDVMGYFVAATVGVASAVDIAALPNLTTTCTQLGSVFYFNNNSDKTIICQAYVNVNIEHTTAAEDNIHITLSDTTATCGSTGAGTAFKEIDANAPIFSGGQNDTISVTQTFSLTANNIQQYFLNATGSAGNDSDILGGKMVCFAAP